MDGIRQGIEAIWQDLHGGPVKIIAGLAFACAVTFIIALFSDGDPRRSKSPRTAKSPLPLPVREREEKPALEASIEP